MRFVFTDRVMVAVLTQHPDLIPLHGGRVSTETIDPLPALRVTNTGDANRGGVYGQSPVFQIDVWATDPIQAGEIAAAVANAVRSVRGQFYDAYVEGAWVNEYPRPLPEADSDFHRYTLEVGLIITGD